MEGSNLITGLPRWPDEQLDPRTFAAVQAIHQAISVLAETTGRLSGIDAPASDVWSQLPIGSTLLLNNSSRVYVPAGEAIVAGQAVRLTGALLEVRLASATSSATAAHGIAQTSAAIGELLEVQLFIGTTTAIALTTGDRYWLSTVPGAIQDTPPVAVGTIQQGIGVALQPALLAFNIGLHWIQN